jgi:hypothetical protein
MSEWISTDGRRHQVIGAACEVCGGDACRIVLDLAEVRSTDAWLKVRQDARHVYCTDHYRPGVIRHLDGSTEPSNLEAVPAL